jgi:hypothetical protein
MSPTLLLPGALVDADWLGAARLAELAALPGWTAVSRRARRVAENGPVDPPPSDPGLERWLHARLGLGSDTALAAAAAYTDDCPGASWRIDPVHLHVGRDHLVLTDPAELSLDAREAQELARAIAPSFEADGLVLDAATPARWYLHEPQPGRALRLRTRPLSGACGRNIDAWLPTGDDARRWRRLVNEVQMIWHVHPVNAAREARRAPTVNSLWIEGRVPGLGGAAAEAASRLATRHAGEGPLRLDAGGVDDTGPLCLDARLHDATLTGDPQGWANAWRALDADTFAAIGHAEAPWPTGALLVLTGDAGWRELAVPPQADWRFWRRTDAAALLAPPPTRDMHR